MECVGHPRHQEIEENIEGLGAKKASELTEATGVRRWGGEELIDDSSENAKSSGSLRR